MNIAQAWFDAGCSVVPIAANGTKRPTREWSGLQRQRMAQEEVTWTWREGQHVGVALICGKVSGNLEMTELEAAGADSVSLEKVRTECRLRGIEDLWERLMDNGYLEWTPSGGLHMLYRVADHDVPGNTKLASVPAKLPDGRPTLKTVAETRGEGGYVIVAPSNGHCHPSGEAWTALTGTPATIPTIAWSQRMTLHAAISAALDESPPVPELPAVRRDLVTVRTADDMRPGDAWEAAHDWDEDWFTGQGWRIHSRIHGGETFWVRPGKDRRDGHSASTGYAGDKDRLFVWSTSAGLPTEQPLTKFWVYAFYHHGGDLARAARYLRSQGYGSTLEPIKPTALKSLDSHNPKTSSGDGKELAVPLPPQGGLDLTDTGSGRRMKEMFGDTFRWNTRSNAWYEWTGSLWRKDEKLSIQRAAEAAAEAAIEDARVALNQVQAIGDEEMIKDAKKALGQARNLLNDGKIKAAIARFQAQPGIAVTHDDFDVDKNLLNLPNGTLDLDSMELRPHDPTDMLTLTMAAEFDKDAEAPQFQRFLDDVLPDPDVQSYVQRALGYSLLGVPNEHTIFMVHGPSGTGKSVLTSLMTRIFGTYGVTAPASTFRLKKQSDSTVDVHRLRGARFVATSELPEGQQLDEDLMKRLTGGDRIQSRGLYESYTEWTPSCVIWLATNFLPRVSSDDNAIWRRAKTIHMNQQFAGEDRILGLTDILYQERDGILNWLLEGLAQYKLFGLAEPQAVTEDVQAYRVDVDIVACFIRDRVEDGLLIKDDGGEIRASVLRALFDQYCAEQHHPLISARKYSNRLKALGYVQERIGAQATWFGLRHEVSVGMLTPIGM